jgi:hypothetical protein
MIYGSCMCKSVRIEIQEPLEHAPEACHCTLCRKQSGHFLVGVNVRRTALTRIIHERLRVGTHCMRPPLFVNNAG